MFTSSISPLAPHKRDDLGTPREPNTTSEHDLEHDMALFQRGEGARFTGKTDPVMEKFNNSLHVDRVMWEADLDGSVAYSQCIEAAGVLSAEEGTSIRSGLESIRAEWAAGTFVVCEGDEDIHTANERRLTELIGPAGGKVHTGRSRNDQVATDVRLHLRGTCEKLGGLLRGLIQVAAKRAAAEADIIMPGYTHLQSAQPIRWAHWLLSHAWSWKRDAERLEQAAARMNECPLGSGALAGNPFGIDREALSDSLGFTRPVQNSIDAVSDRDFVAELSFWAALLQVHLSKFAEDLIIWNTQEFAFVKMADAYSTGSLSRTSNPNPNPNPYPYPYPHQARRSCRRRRTPTRASCSLTPIPTLTLTLTLTLALALAQVRAAARQGSAPDRAHDDATDDAQGYAHRVQQGQPRGQRGHLRCAQHGGGRTEHRHWGARHAHTQARADEGAPLLL